MPDEEKGLGSKILGLFVEREGQPAPPEPEGQSAADLVAELARQGGAGGAERPGVPGAANKSVGAAPDPKLENLAAQGGGGDFEAIFKEIMDAETLDRVKKAEEVLRGLPEGTPVALKRQIVETSLKAFGIPIEKIVEGAKLKQQALDRWVKVNSEQTVAATEEARKRIAGLKEQIVALEADIAKRDANLKSLEGAASARRAEVQKVVDFFNAPAGAAGQG